MMRLPFSVVTQEVTIGAGPPIRMTLLVYEEHAVGQPYIVVASREHIILLERISALEKALRSVRNSLESTFTVPSYLQSRIDEIIKIALEEQE